ncbi:flagellar biosynthesis protein FlhF [Allobacillus sp. GCM10007491]|uniref:Flagellar biosynthesis protein FlhF n=1 Tax=Allobacillus saliphilus TaxID=2912308 RepID=A0A941CTM4_9BACI|nr:flagellar biosynthesis protein FlhF [Allobacillus saliphilus]MBR7552906.1 flagellar biosynthesis protein FlhF [Allobacillus saliphilus]
MKVKKFIAPTMPEAMNQVKKELGESAIILDSREIKTSRFFGLFGKRNIEVLAAVDPQPTRNRNAVRSKKETANHATKRSNHVKSVQKTKTSEEKVSARLSLSNEYPHPVESTLQRLRQNGIDEDTRANVLQTLLSTYYKKDEEMTESELLDVTKEFFKKEMSPYIQGTAKQSKHLYILGPTGVGKTTTIAKMAANDKMKYSKDIAFITLDTYRIAAIEQLKTYAKILDIPIEVAYNAEDLEAAKDKFEDKDLIYIDTAGRNYMKNEYIHQLKDMAKFKEQDQLICVLSLTSKEDDMNMIYHQFSELPVDTVIFTKADETSTYGQIFNLWKKHRFDILALTNGQDVPNDLLDVDEEVLARIMVGEKLW